MPITSLPVEIAFSLRREGFELSTRETLDIARALTLVDLESEVAVRETLRAIVATTKEENERFDRAFARFFFAKEKTVSLIEDLRLRGFSPEELEKVRGAIERTAKVDDVAFGALVQRGADYDRLLALVSQTGQDMRRLGQLGEIQERANEATGLLRAESMMAELERRFRDLFGERANEILDLIRERLRETKREVRTQLRESFDRREGTRDGSLEEKTFAALDEREIEDVRKVVRKFADRLRGGELVRRRHALRGRLDATKTLREAMRTYGIPVRLVRKKPRRKKTKLVLLCDISDSVRSAAVFMLEFVAVAHDLFSDARSFVFVSDLAETTELFEKDSISRALQRVASGELISVRDNSNYGRALRTFEGIYGPEIDRRTTLVILGDARTNYGDPGLEALRDLKKRAGHVIWLCPEKKDQWGAGDSAILAVAKHCTKLLEAANVTELESALRLIGRLRGRS